jgi:hypothetical protein
MARHKLLAYYDSKVKDKDVPLQAGQPLRAMRGDADTQTPHGTEPVLVNALDVAQAAFTTLGRAITNKEAAAALAAVNQEAVHRKHLARFEVEIWDGKSPALGMDAEAFAKYLKERGDVPEGGEVYIVYRDGHPAILQPHHPDAAGLIPIDASMAVDTSMLHSSGFCEQDCRQEIIRLALAALA